MGTLPALCRPDPGSGVNLTGRSQQITADIIAVLEAEAPLPISTARLLARINPPLRTIGERMEAIEAGRLVMHGELLRLLNRLAKRGEVEKWPAGGDQRSCYWRRLGEPSS